MDSSDLGVQAIINRAKSILNQSQQFRSGPANRSHIPVLRTSLKSPNAIRRKQISAIRFEEPKSSNTASSDEDEEDGEESSIITSPTLSDTFLSERKQQVEAKLQEMTRIGVTSAPSRVKGQYEERTAVKTLAQARNAEDSDSDDESKLAAAAEEDLEPKPAHVFLSSESQAVVQMMTSLKEKGKAKAKRSSSRKGAGRRSHSPAFPSLTDQLHSSKKSYSEDFVSEIQSVVDEFSKSFGEEQEEMRSRNESLIQGVTGNTVSEAIEIPEDLDQEDSEATLKSSSSKSKSRSRSNSYQKLQESLHFSVVQEIKENLQELTASSNRAEENEDDRAQREKEENEGVVAEVLKFDGNDQSQGVEDDDERNYDEENYGESSFLQEDSQSALVLSSSSASRARLQISKSSRKSSSAAKSPSSRRSASASASVSQKRHPILIQKQSSRKLLQNTLSKISLFDKDGEETPIERPEAIVDLAPQKVSMRVPSAKNKNEESEYSAPRTKAQSNIQSILEKEIYRKELNRLRKMNREEDREKKKLQEMESRIKALEKARSSSLNGNFAMKGKESGSKSKVKASSSKSRAKKAKSKSKSKSAEKDGNGNANASVVGTESVWRTQDPMLLNTDSSLSASYPNEDYVEKVSKMDISELVNEVMKSNERMYNATMRAANAMTKKYRERKKW